jgi:hypothetical protein
VVQYRYAFDSNGTVVTADFLAGTEITGTYSCISCDQPLIARVNGKIQRPHFGHKAQVECNGETYLHRLAKRVFQETYSHCLKTCTPFTITFTTPRICNKYKSLITRCCELGEDHHEYDLTQYYTDIHMETRDGEFIPDISLHSKTRPNDLIYLEIAVSHFLSEAKSASAKRIIEIPIRNEDDVDAIRAAKLTPENASFTGFFPKVNAVSDAECKCAREQVFAFYVFNSGKAYLDHGPLQQIQSKILNNKDKLKYVNLIPDQSDDKKFYSFGRTRGYLFVEQVRLAHERSVLIKNCYLCRYHGDNWDASVEHSIFCKTLKKPCNSNEASQCDRYQLQ